MIIAWFSCGATSAIACKMALQMYEDVRVVYIDTGTAHEDNERFIRDCEQWYGTKIETIRSDKYLNVQDVIKKTHFINSPNGASCTYHLKKLVRRAFEEQVKNWGGANFGFDFCEKEINRAIRFKQQNPQTKPLFPLIERQVTKENALAMLMSVGIEIPTMYKLGYSNNNCICCVKGGIGYWNKIRKDFPAQFQMMSAIERELNATCLKDDNGRIFLDELDPNRGANDFGIIPECTLFCDIEFADVIDRQTKKVIEGTCSINDTI